ncbi:MAG: VanW family protein, partial [Candidatus Nomurabacteria bacterium]|nr:VanW family protein [Candidatus Nomurabacteria bacterium]
MKKKARRTIILLSAVVSGIFVLALLATVVVFAVWSNGDTIIQNMSYRDINLSRMTTEQANQSIKESITPSEKRVKFLLGDKSISMSPSEISFSYDPTLIAETAFARARNKTFFKNYAVWTQSWFTKSIIADAQVESYNILSLETIFDVWDSEILGEPTTGDIKINKTEISFTPPRPGSKIDRPTAAKYIVASFVEEPDKALIIPTVSIPITVNVESISNVYEHLVALTDEPIILKAGDLYPDSNVTLSPKDLRRILYLERDEETFEYTTLINLERLQGYFKEITVRDAEFDTKDMFNVKIIPSQDGLLIDYDLTALAILEHDTSTGREINFINDGKHDALFNTKDAEGLGIKHLISEFTTYHPCCQTRVENIQLFADLLDGTIIKPNNRFNLNTAIGERTEDLGFSPAGTIIAGELVDTVGGGISQFATTFYNTVFWAGFPNIIHKPHSFYFPRYPEGIEATISWPYPALVFRNDND